MEGYDQRTRYSDKYKFTYYEPYRSYSQNGHAFLKKEQVISYRDDAIGVPVLDSVADPHAYRMRTDSTLKYDEQEKVQKALKAAGLPGLPDYEVRRFVDNGHTFYKETHKVGTSLRTERTYQSGVENYQTSPTESRKGSPFYNQFSVSDSCHSGLIFPIRNTELGAGKVIRFDMPWVSPPLGPLQRDASDLLVRSAPGQPSVGIAQIVGELYNDGLPKIPGLSLAKKPGVSSGGDEWLNFLFGIVPTVGDALDLAKALSNFTKLFLQYRRDAGRVVRRTRALPVQNKNQTLPLDASTLEFGAAAPVLRSGNSTNYGFGFNPTFYSGIPSYQPEYYRYTSPSAPLGKRTVFKSELLLNESRFVSFAGAFTYYIPQADGFAGRIERYFREFDHVIDLSLDLNEAWQLTPWSWLVDWWLDIGDTLGRVELVQDDNLVINYGYGMESVKRDLIAKTTVTYDDRQSGFSYVSTYKSAEFKRRIRANPFGFVSQNDVDLTPYRLSILAALGISRL